MKRLAAIAAILGTFWSCSIANAAPGAISVFSEGETAHNCFRAALYDSAPRPGIADCSAALDSGSLSPDDRAATLINRGILRERLSDFGEALEDYNAGLTLRPDLADAYIDRGAVFIKMTRYSDAIADLNKGITMGTQSLHIAYYDRGVARERTGDPKGACADYRQAVTLQPNFILAKDLFAICSARNKP